MEKSDEGGNMSILAQITTKKRFNINGLELDLGSIELDQDTVALMDIKEDTPNDVKLDLIKKAVKKMVKDSVPDATEEELNEMVKLKNLIPLIDAFYEVNGMMDEKNLSNAQKIKNAISKRTGH